MVKEKDYKLAKTFKRKPDADKYAKTQRNYGYGARLRKFKVGTPAYLKGYRYSVFLTGRKLKEY